MSKKSTGLLASAILAGTILAGGIGSAALAAPANAAPDHRAKTYTMTGDEGGSKFEGIGADQRRGTFYVSEVTGGEIHRGVSGTPQMREWLGGNGTDGRFTARGITVDRAGNIYIAGGPNGIGNDRPDLWVYNAKGELQAALKAPGTDVFLNDVVIGADGAAYFTNSNDAQIFRVAASGGEYKATLWADAGTTIERKDGFNLGGIELTADRSAFVVAQGNAGTLWRFDIKTRKAAAIDTLGIDLVNADGLLLRGNTLTVVQNFTKKLTTLRLSADGSSVRLLGQRATDPDRVLTTVARLRGQILFVDSKFDEQVASGPYEVVTSPLAR
ncbi:SBBP repeat-containing protein [Paeniglutamicibacter sp. NPDC012692]|uniref:SBBP repeat-containing protein n=1 Tax=Paeniglutamicibacter sp. NPDC012692 TaxID=3364388 RepID=UPI00369FBD47